MQVPPGAPALPALPKLPAKEMAGPTPWSNWVIPGRIIAGAYPASLDDVETERILSTMLELGVNTFVCLQAEVNINTPEHAWRAQHGLRPYIKDAQKILSKAHETGNPRITQQKIDFLHLPIIDGNVTTDSAMNRLAEDCNERVLRGEKMYIHCWGGHGRTGTLVAVMLGRLYNLPYTTALRYTQGFHDSRIYPQGVRSPQTPVQRAQVRRLLAAQSAVPSSGPGAINSVIRPMPSAAPSSSRPVLAAGYGMQKAPVAMLPVGGSAAGAGRISSSFDRGSGGDARTSPSRARAGISPSAAGLARHSPAGVRNSISGDRPGALGLGSAQAGDRLASDFSKLQGPSAAAGRPSGGYVMAQR
mmetsp:Transcript_2457/g.4125  ORF Transcript_2457/g.4125 Transcript_2457/m.4125 type:complete len:359 (+) Transcript_2457:184-1260(+)|eukprot:CAMPEP_0119116204 /NCGR_PEP_ID=MMETSP1180-20130426/52156_1 /TAXON_ID=3052 ORGANISM="Chlamydomonas cf sp, Strain CCMP681" /NCGR_SAMPLE_ID=MMETSP1180 /ASSEMBLY_ACC=CAM_ASM_000741 /LENGTH=358 /DNA_ID=CAMNT_0007105329 /DNA_START=82 /DNA_END=1158 /DNA_ORIENTATION=-